jgi:hypothetical protein
MTAVITKYPYTTFDYGLIFGGGGVYKIGKKNCIDLDILYQMGKGFDATNGSSTENQTRNLSLNVSYIF